MIGGVWCMTKRYMLHSISETHRDERVAVFMGRNPHQDCVTRKSTVFLGKV